jgi:hypothetical protein
LFAAASWLESSFICSSRLALMALSFLMAVAWEVFCPLRHQGPISRWESMTPGKYVPRDAALIKYVLAMGQAAA